jgi:hypothetical protein
MAGSGGRYFPSYTPSEFREKVREADAEDRDEAFEANANQVISDYLAQFNARDAAAINKVLEKIRTELANQLEGTVDLLFGGSVAKRTYVDGLSDVDALLLLNATVAAELSPAQIREECGRHLREVFGKENVWVGQLAVTVKAGDHEIQLLPAIRTGEHFKIGSANGTDWERIRPRVFAAKLTEANGNLGNKLVPTIKLIKAAIAQLPEQKRLSGYHVEALALKIFDGYAGELTSRTMLKHFFEQSPNHLTQPIPDVTGQSDHVDGYLGEAGSLQRRVAADACGRIGRRMRNADAAKDLTLWRQLFGDGTIT